MGWNVQLPTAEYITSKTVHLDSIVREVQDQKYVAIDTETDGLSIVTCKPYYWSLSWSRPSGEDVRLTLNADTFPAFSHIFAETNRSWVLANAKFDAHMLANRQFPLMGRLIDIQVQHALLYEEEPHGLKDMARVKLGWHWTDFSDTFGKIRKNYCMCGGTFASHKPTYSATDGKQTGIYCKTTGCSNYTEADALSVLRRAEKDNINLLVDYAANDAYATWKLFHLMNKELTEATTLSLYPDRWPNIKTLYDYFYQTEVPFTRVLYACERNGLKVDRGYLEGIAPKIVSDLADLRSRINSLTGKLMKTSGPSLAKYFIDDCGIRPHKMTKGGKSGIKKPSIDSKFLTYVSEEHRGETSGKVAALLLEHEAIAKQYSTYIEKMPGRLDGEDYVHMRLNQDVARTGRLSSSDPNMQNVTTGEKDRFHLRNAFICEPDEDIVVADYSQLEMRLLAAASQEPAMMEIFHRNWDIHMGNASFVFDIPYEEIAAAKDVEKQVKKGKLPETAMTARVWQCLKARADVKNIGFGLNYGMKERSLAARMDCSVEEAIEKIGQYMERYPAVRAFFAEAVEEVREYGYAFTLLGRRRSLPDIDAHKDYLRFRAERQASNMPIQGTAAEVCKMAMINIYEDTELRNKYGYKMRLQVHDEILGTCPKEVTHIVKPRVSEWMEHPFPTDIGVPLLADIGSASSWGGAK
jgi:DNA polymerase I-like protein with 3'-5' exonuclease and polymerase domains